jgi:hypothetical protein
MRTFRDDYADQLVDHFVTSTPLLLDELRDPGGRGQRRAPAISRYSRTWAISPLTR